MGLACWSRKPRGLHDTLSLTVQLGGAMISYDRYTDCMQGLCFGLEGAQWALARITTTNLAT